MSGRITFESFLCSPRCYSLLPRTRGGGGNDVDRNLATPGPRHHVMLSPVLGGIAPLFSELFLPQEFLDPGHGVQVPLERPPWPHPARRPDASSGDPQLPAPYHCVEEDNGPDVRVNPGTPEEGRAR
jgi:hypothetical protein